MARRRPPATTATPTPGAAVIIAGPPALLEEELVPATILLPAIWLEPPPLDACVRGIWDPAVQLVGASLEKLMDE